MIYNATLRLVCQSSKRLAGRCWIKRLLGTPKNSALNNADNTTPEEEAITDEASKEVEIFKFQE
jgi:hypothetical protein